METDAKKRIRGRNFTEKDKDLLLDCIKPHLKTIECAETNKKSNQDKDIAWVGIEASFNAQTNFPRDAKSLKSFYQQFKMRAKKDNAAFKVNKTIFFDIFFLTIFNFSVNGLQQVVARSLPKSIQPPRNYCP